MQNITATGEYCKTVLDGNGATTRGYALAPADKLRALAISTLLCSFRLSERDVSGFGAGGRALMSEAEAIALTDDDNLVEMRDGVFSVTERGRPFVRTIAARFDSYLGQGMARHSSAI